jgi:hypothetical protein
MEDGWIPGSLDAKEISCWWTGPLCIVQGQQQVGQPTTTSHPVKYLELPTHKSIIYYIIRRMNELPTATCSNLCMRSLLRSQEGS